MCETSVHSSGCSGGVRGSTAPAVESQRGEHRRDWSGTRHRQGRSGAPSPSHCTRDGVAEPWGQGEGLRAPGIERGKVDGLREGLTGFC